MLSACASPQIDSAAATTDAPVALIPLQLDLPARYEAWRKPLLQEWAQMTQRFPEVAARWPRDLEMQKLVLRVVVPADTEASIAFYQTAQLEGEPSVPRTFPSLGLAVVPLPRNDALIAALPAPLETWKHGFRHECAHLLSLDRPGLRAAPSWFQEGFAELWCAPDAGKTGELLELPHQWPFWGSMHRWWIETGQQAPAEIVYNRFAAWVAEALYKDSGPTPWPHMPRSPQYAEAGADFVGLRGRHADWDVDSGRYLLAARPGKQVDLDLPQTWDGEEALQLTMQIGRSPGEPEAGVVLFGSGVSETRIRLRYGLGGGFTAYIEDGMTAGFETFAVPNERDSVGVARTATLRLQDGKLVVAMLNFERFFDLEKLNLHPPFQLRMVVRDGAFLLYTK